MNERWTLEIDRQVAGYLYLLREEGHELRNALHSLSANPFPHDAQIIQDEPETWEWLEARHWILYVVDRPKHWICVTVIESATVP